MSNCVLLIASEQHTKSCVGRGGEGMEGQGRAEEGKNQLGNRTGGA